MNNLLTNSPGNDLPVVSIVIALFFLVTIYYGLLLQAFKMPFKKLIVSYSIIIILLIIILLISRYYFTFFGTYESFIANFKSSHNSNLKQNKEIDVDTDTNLTHPHFTKSPFSTMYDVDEMCKEATPHKLDRNNISWKCRVRNEYGHDSFSLETSANEAGKESSVQYKLKYDGILDIK
jgi:hypothetical protein